MTDTLGPRQRGEGSLGAVTRKSQKAAFSVLETTQTQAEEGQIKVSTHIYSRHKLAYNIQN